MKETFYKQMNNPLSVGIAGLVVGAIVGLVILGWWLFPVQWTDGAPSDLQYDYQVDYMRMAIDSFSVNGDAALALARYEVLGEQADEILITVANDPRTQSPDVIEAFTMVVAGSTAVIGPDMATPTPVPEEGGGIRSLLPILCVAVFLVFAVLVALYIIRIRGRLPFNFTRKQKPAEEPQPVSVAGEPGVYAVKPAVLKQFIASYQFGDDLFDESYGIESPAKDFLGECGVGISETIGVGDPKKITAFEVWLFDKDDIQTVTKVLMSEHAFNDPNIRQRLAAKGEPVMVAPGVTTSLETESLILDARVVDLGYGDGALPPQSYFERFILEISVASKNV